MWTILLSFLLIFTGMVFSAGNETLQEQNFEEYIIEALTNIEKEQQALTSDTNTRFQQEHDAFENLLKFIEDKQKTMKANLNNLSYDSLLELQHLMRSPLTSLQLFVDQDIQKQQKATEVEYLQQLIDVRIGLRENKNKCGPMAINLNTKYNNLIFALAYIALQKPDYYMPVYTCATLQNLPNDCSKVVPFESGLLPIRIAKETIQLLCDNELENGGWTVILKRFDGQEFFHNRTKEEYIMGFGNLCHEFFVGIQTMQMLLEQNATYLLRVEMTDFNNQTAVAHYDGISLMNVDWAESTTYHIKWLGTYSGNAGDALSVAVGADITASQRLYNIFGLYGGAGTPADEDNMMWSTFSNESLKSITLLLRLQNLGIPEIPKIPEETK